MVDGLEPEPLVEAVEPAVELGCEVFRIPADAAAGVIETLEGVLGPELVDADEGLTAPAVDGEAF